MYKAIEENRFQRWKGPGKPRDCLLVFLLWRKLMFIEVVVLNGCCYDCGFMFSVVWWRDFDFCIMFLSICSGCDSFAELECFVVLEQTSSHDMCSGLQTTETYNFFQKKTKQVKYFAVTWLLPICIRISFACCFRNHHHCSKDHIHALYDLIGENKDYTVSSTDNWHEGSDREKRHPLNLWHRSRNKV
jgi:hypothetical protein